MDCSGAFNYGTRHVCASDGNTYANFCELKKAACKRSLDFKIKFVHYGSCQGKITMLIYFFVLNVSPPFNLYLSKLARSL